MKLLPDYFKKKKWPRPSIPFWGFAGPFYFRQPILHPVLPREYNPYVYKVLPDGLAGSANKNKLVFTFPLGLQLLHLPPSESVPLAQPFFPTTFQPMLATVQSISVETGPCRSTPRSAIGVLPGKIIVQI